MPTIPIPNTGTCPICKIEHIVLTKDNLVPKHNSCAPEWMSTSYHLRPPCEGSLIPALVINTPAKRKPRRGK